MLQRVADIGAQAARHAFHQFIHAPIEMELFDNRQAATVLWIRVIAARIVLDVGRASCGSCGVRWQRQQANDGQDFHGELRWLTVSSSSARAPARAERDCRAMDSRQASGAWPWRTSVIKCISARAQSLALASWPMVSMPHWRSLAALSPARSVSASTGRRQRRYSYSLAGIWLLQLAACNSSKPSAACISASAAACVCKGARVTRSLTPYLTSRVASHASWPVARSSS